PRPRQPFQPPRRTRPLPSTTDPTIRLLGLRPRAVRVPRYPCTDVRTLRRHLAAAGRPLIGTHEVPAHADSHGRTLPLTEQERLGEPQRALRTSVRACPRPPPGATLATAPRAGRRCRQPG